MINFIKKIFGLEENNLNDNSYDILCKCYKLELDALPPYKCICKPVEQGELALFSYRGTAFDTYFDHDDCCNKRNYTPFQRAVFKQMIVDSKNPPTQFQTEMNKELEKLCDRLNERYK